MRDDLHVMQAGQPGYRPKELGEIETPVWVILGENEEFIRREHAEYMARTLRKGRFLLLHGVSHFAPLQRPAQFNRAILDFLASLQW
jgi:pimeloyl-ACP methyl ester carboxylesterase